LAADDPAPVISDAFAANAAQKASAARKVMFFEIIAVYPGMGGTVQRRVSVGNRYAGNSSVR
jgi:hypothetical protein